MYYLPDSEKKYDKLKCVYMRYKILMQKQIQISFSRRRT